MATTAKKKTTKKVDVGANIKAAFKEYILLHGNEPTSVFAFCKDLNIDEAKFYDYYASFESVKKAIWAGYIEETLNVLHKDQNYPEFSAREKLLSFYYTLLEVLKADRSYVMMCFKNLKKSEIKPAFLEGFKEHFENFSSNLVNEGMQTNEVQDRPVIGKRYHEALWLQLMFVINFWIKDTSQKFEKTDAAIEKAVSLSFDLMGPGPLDSMIDFAKFLYHNR